jgi:hypothetical protein
MRSGTGESFIAVWILDVASITPGYRRITFSAAVLRYDWRPGLYDRAGQIEMDRTGALGRNADSPTQQKPNSCNYDHDPLLLTHCIPSLMSCGDSTTTIKSLTYHKAKR